MSRKKIIILGGLGFIGKNLYMSLRHDYDVTILTATIHEDNFINPSIREKIIVGSILDNDFIEKALVGFDIIFSLAGSSGAAQSVSDPYQDLETNLRGHLNILEACRKYNPRALLVFPSTRLVYGKPKSNPVNEANAIKPESIYAIHKLTIEYYYQLYQSLYNLNSIIFRISNPFGPYQLFGNNKYGILNWFIYKAIKNHDIEIYGDGSQKRDFIFIDDLINLFRISIENERLYGKIYNVGGGVGISLKQAASVIVNQVPGSKITVKPWPKIDEKIETGDYVSDITLLNVETGWAPMVKFEDGMKQTINYYQEMPLNLYQEQK